AGEDPFGARELAAGDLQPFGADVRADAADGALGRFRAGLADLLELGDVFGPRRFLRGRGGDKAGQRAEREQEREWSGERTGHQLVASAVRRLPPRGSSRSSQAGVRQTRSPISSISAGSRTMRTTVASKRIAAVSPSPIWLTVATGAIANEAKTAAMIAAAP